MKTTLEFHRIIKSLKPYIFGLQILINNFEFYIYMYVCVLVVYTVG